MNFSSACRRIFTASGQIGIDEGSAIIIDGCRQNERRKFNLLRLVIDKALLLATIECNSFDLSQLIVTGRFLFRDSSGCRLIWCSENLLLNFYQQSWAPRRSKMPSPGNLMNFSRLSSRVLSIFELLSWFCIKVN